MYKLFLVIVLCINIFSCSHTKKLKTSGKTPNLHDNYSMIVDQRMYAVLPLPFEFSKDDFVEFHILEYPKKGKISLVDRYRGFFNYVPREGVYGYDFFVYNVSDGKSVVKKIIQLNIKEK